MFARTDNARSSVLPRCYLLGTAAQATRGRRKGAYSLRRRSGRSGGTGKIIGWKTILVVHYGHQIAANTII